MPILVISAVILIAAIVIALTLAKKRKPQSPPVTDTVNIYRSILGTPAGAAPSSPSPSTPTSDDPDLVARLRQDLRLKFLYQEDKVDQAIQTERDRTPTASLTDLMQAAIARYERENQ